MKRYFLSIYHWLGGIYCALILILFTALFVIAGTFLESWSGSHRYAAQFTYSSPLFALLLWGFFINILFSALRRWPFKTKHIPFLITHLGLLMVIGGILGKHYFGIQGTMLLKEGSGSHEVAEADTYSLHIKEADKPAERYRLINNTRTTNGRGLSFTVGQIWPHHEEKLVSWVFDGKGVIKGLKPIPEEQTSNPVRFFPEPAPLWNVRVIQGELAPHYLSLVELEILANQKTQQQISLQEAIAHPINLNAVTITTSLERENGIPSSIKLKINGDLASTTTIPLLEAASLNEESLFHLGIHPIQFKLKASPTLYLCKNNKDEITLFAINEEGKIWHQKQNQGVLLSYDDGFAGYGTRTEIPSSFLFCTHEECRRLSYKPLEQQLQLAVTEHKELCPPLKMLQEASLKAQTDFPTVSMEFLIGWNGQYGWLFSPVTPLSPELSKTLLELDWSDEEILQGAHWTSQVFRRLERGLREGVKARELLKQENWPLIHGITLEGKNDRELLTLVTQQIFSAASTRHENSQKPATVNENARLLSTFMRAYQIHLSEMTQGASAFDIVDRYKNHTSLVLESPVIPKSTKKTPSKKIEENIPAAIIQFNEDGRSEIAALSFRPMGKGLRWPILQGKYLVRMEPYFREIPYHLRLRTARQINYLHSNQAFSYESDLIITDRNDHTETEATISMNQVYETWDGYRFYLSTISSGDEDSVKQIQLVVNYDPVKYIFTYPGAIVMCCGILLLLWMRPYKNKERSP